MRVASRLQQSVFAGSIHCSVSPVDNLYLHIVLGCAHEQIRKHMACYAVVIGVVKKTQCLLRSWGLPNDLKNNKASFSTISIHMSWLWVAQMPRCPDLVIFVLTDDGDRQTHPITLPLVHVRPYGGGLFETSRSNNRIVDVILKG